MPTPAQILETINLALRAVLEFLKWIQTEEGKAFLAQTTKDRTAWDSFWQDLGNGVRKLFAGELFKP